MTADDQHEEFGGLSRDLTAMIDRRHALRLLGGAGLAGFVAACSSGGSSSSSPTTTAASAPETTASTTAAPTTTASAATDAPPTTATTVADVGPSPGEEIPSEGAGPFPADGTNGPNVLDIDGVVRQDMTNSIGELSGTAPGTPMTLQLTIVDADTGTPLPGAAVYVWHNTADGRYSIYEIDDQNYLRAVQAADDSGRVTFTTIYPGCYPGRWPHCHFEVYDSLDEATVGNDAIKTTQLALPQADSEAVYVGADYGESAAELAQLSLATDGIFRDGWQDQLATVAANADGSYTASLLVRV
ncbi:MAG: hypothetical protein AAGA99_02900 [Actinomycetota bacterium]